VFEALTQHPTLIAGEGRFNTLLNRFLGGKGIGKGGAEGVFGACLINPPLGIAVKLSDGSSRSHPAILASLLERYLPDLPWPTFCEQCNPPLRNTRGELVGQICAAT
jgi:L-asparaginase II